MAKPTQNKKNGGTYQATVICLNCDFRGKIDIKKGIQIKESACPNCGNKTMRLALPGEAS